MCVALTLILTGPRFGIILWWLINPDRWDNAFSSVFWPILGFIFLPWTTIMFVAVAPFGNVAGWDWFWIGLGLLLDVSAWASSGYGNRGRIPGYV